MADVLHFADLTPKTPVPTTDDGKIIAVENDPSSGVKGFKSTLVDYAQYVGDVDVTGLTTTAQNIIGAINEIGPGATYWTRITGTPNYLEPTTGGDDVDMGIGDVTATDITATNEVITDMIQERTTDNGIAMGVSGNFGKFYDYPTPHNTWFVFSGSGSPDDGTNIYLPYSSTDGTWFGFGMAAADQIHFGTNGTEVVITGDGQFKAVKLRLGATQQVDAISTATDLGGGASSNDNLATQLAIKTYVDGHTSNNIWTRAGTTITVTNADDNLDFSTAGVKIDSVASLFDVVAATGITPVVDMIIPIRSSTGGDTNITANPQIEAGNVGQRLTLIGTDDTRTVTLDDGDGLALDNGQSFTLGENDVIEFVFYNSLWIETTRKDN